MTRLTDRTPAEKRFIDEAVDAAERASGKKLSPPDRRIVLKRARAQIESQRRAADRRFRRFRAAGAAKPTAIHFPAYPCSRAEITVRDFRRLARGKNPLLALRAQKRSQRA